ncbi:MAG: DUF2207 domain-containing protein [Candidatus Longimicrobiales bacterium M2_2A_002]
MALLLAVALGALVGAGAPPGVGPAEAAAQDRSIVIQELNAVYDVREDGTVDVEERYRVRFNGSWNGLRRTIELRPPEGYPWEEPTGLTLTGTTNGAGRELRNEVSRQGRYGREILVYVPNASDRTADVVIRYTLDDALGFYAAAPDRDPPQPAMDEFYWQVTGTDWEIPIRAVTAEVRLPMAAAVSQAAAYQGGVMSRDQAPVTIDGSTIRTEAVGSIDPGDGLTIGVGWPAGAVDRDPSRVMQWGEASLGERLAGDRPGPLTYLPLGLPLVIFWFAYRAWDRRGRDPKERAIMVRWEPPADLSPAEVGTLVDHSPEMHDIISTLVEMAVKGYVVIEEREKEGFLKFGTDYVFHLVRPESEWGDLVRHQERFLQGLFEHRSAGVRSIIKEAIGLEEDASEGAPPEAVASVKLSDLENEFYKEVPEIKDAIFDALVRKGHYLRRPDKARQPWIFGAGVMGFAGFAGFMMLADGGQNPFLGVVLIVAAVASAVILIVFGMIMPARTEQGARTREAALGFKQFLEKVEDPRYERMIKSPDQFEEYLPYAMAFECQEQWARAFEDILTEPPDWYYGGHGHFHASTFAADMSSMATTASTAMASSPSSSGSGGGGSVGGGGGGGGGGGF